MTRQKTKRCCQENLKDLRYVKSKARNESISRSPSPVQESYCHTKKCWQGHQIVIRTKIINHNGRNVIGVCIRSKDVAGSSNRQCPLVELRTLRNIVRQEGGVVKQPRPSKKEVPWLMVCSKIDTEKCQDPRDQHALHVRTASAKTITQRGPNRKIVYHHSRSCQRLVHRGGKKSIEIFVYR